MARRNRYDRKRNCRKTELQQLTKLYSLLPQI